MNVMSRFQTEFVKPFNREIEDKVRKPTVEVMQDTAEAVYTKIMDLWPTDTFWSQANHRINIGPNPARDFPIEPPQRPAIAGELTGQANENEQEQLAKLEDLAFGDSILIGNAVPYAADVGRRGGNGTRIYAEAAAIGVSTIQSRLK